ncbi:hypothetical protein HS088_TW13G01381 [Tripterygium wilfordii]|uniref:Uncharacterized protein n=1 Tax=Tripterygium wilfordii TaxID=458696 RepID=A0A7J7CWG7_TRIWF|nr:uncharacterized protein LOC120012193 [Tripterygium wilfordii]KAF5738482.1 hypothetical protein HS088_TW13G01381 [Tripterygium wilfordii]
MAKPEFWLPTGFIVDKDSAMETEILKKNASKADVAPSLSFPMEFPYEFDSFGSSCSALSSPGESVVGCIETESCGEEDFLMTGLTRRLNQSSISETRKIGPKPESMWVMAGSPESTLSGARQLSVSSNGSSSGVSPPMTPFGERYNTWDLIYEAAGQVARLKMTNEAPKFYSSNFQARLGPRESHGPARSQNQVTGVIDTSHSDFCEAHGFTHNVSQQMNLQYQRARLEQLVKQRQHKQRQCASVWAKQVDLNLQLQNQQIQSAAQRASGFQTGRCGNPVTVGVPQSAWPRLLQSPLHQSQQFAAQSQHLNPGMKAIVPGGSGVKRVCAGTGVFLPRRYGNNNPQPCKKTGYSAATLPVKVVHSHPHTQAAFNTVLPSEYEALVARRNAVLTLQKRMLQQENHDLGLPQEWAY